MHHLYLSREGVFQETADRDTYQPQGSVIAAMSKRMIRMWWVDLICEHLAPFERDKFPSKREIHLPSLVENFGWQPQQIDAVLNAFKPELWVQWMGRSASKSLEDAYDKLWASISSGQGFMDALGMEPSGLLHLTDTRPVSFADRKDFVHVLLEDGSNEAIESLAGKDDVVVDSKRVTRTRHKMDFLDLGWPAERVAKAIDKEQRLDPDYENPAQLIKIEQVIVPSKAAVRK